MAASGLGKCDLMWCEHDEHHRCSQSHLSQVHFDYDFVVWGMTIQRWLTVIAFKRSQRKLLTAFDSAKEYRWLSQDFHDTSLSPHQLESSSTTPLQLIDLIALNADVLVRYFHISRKSIPCRCCRFLQFQHKYFRHISTTLLKNWAHHSAWHLVGCIGTCCCWTRGERIIINLQPTFSSLSSRLRSSSLNYHHTLGRYQAWNVTLSLLKTITSTSMTTLPTFVGQVFAWAQSHNHQCVLFDPLSRSVDR